MPALVWDQVGQRFYETGVDHGVLYIPDELLVIMTLVLHGMVLLASRKLQPVQKQLLSTLTTLSI